MRKTLSFLMLGLLLSNCNMSATKEEAELHMKNENYEAAAIAFSKVIRLEPGDNYSIYNRAQAYEKLGEFESAYDDYTRLIALKWKTKLALIGRARCNFELENYSGVIKNCTGLCRLMRVSFSI